MRVMYHGTSVKKAKKILKEGLKPGCPPLYEESGTFFDLDSGTYESKDVVYLTTKLKDAKEFAGNAARVEKNGEPCVLEVNVEEIDYNFVYGGMPGEYCTSRRISPRRIRKLRRL